MIMQVISREVVVNENVHECMFAVHANHVLSVIFSSYMQCISEPKLSNYSENPTCAGCVALHLLFY